MTQTIVLASGSPYRAELLLRLGMAFEIQSPNIDESALPGESAQQLVARLASAKAKAVLAALSSHDTIVIASDQVAALDDLILTKPGDSKNAKTQLQSCSGKRVVFYTSLCVLGSCGSAVQEAVITTRVDFRELTSAQIETYLIKEEPFDCAGSFKVEGLGITLFEKIHSDDPTALIGLPLIALTSALQKIGVDPLT